MKAKIFLLVCLVQVSFSYAANGELIFKFLTGTTPGTFNLTVSSTNYSWHWENNSVILDDNLYYHAVTNQSEYDFSAPKISPGDGDYPISWGLMVITITTNTGLSRTFTLDLRDENWSQVLPYKDTHILINDDANSFYISQNDGINNPYHYQAITNYDTIEIWDLWDIVGIQNNNFTIPIILKNRIEDGPQTDFGTLWANSVMLQGKRYF